MSSSLTDGQVECIQLNRYCSTPQPNLYCCLSSCCTQHTTLCKSDTTAQYRVCRFNNTSSTHRQHTQTTSSILSHNPTQLASDMPILQLLSCQAAEFNTNALLNAAQVSPSLTDGQLRCIRMPLPIMFTIMPHLMRHRHRHNSTICHSVQYNTTSKHGQHCGVSTCLT